MDQSDWEWSAYTGLDNLNVVIVLRTPDAVSGYAISIDTLKQGGWYLLIDIFMSMIATLEDFLNEQSQIVTKL